ncbi:hypothetical protein BDB00DRAFT_790010 [Zychaea mexicana]|uniref:uncharacterized protein n=1 Tax=Zychaea mexicana TaxID=64656 RepID=UPI0022FE34F2|nr:uncharacterized protein BDB00DRAFT_790010 [Zychaea mexicana]KAI9490764.1 hypothetical protein BDB00DRAFT_790010 [Zychaea mexicana]
MATVTTLVQRPRRAAAVRAESLVQYNKRGREERKAAKVEKRRRKEEAVAAKAAPSPPKQPKKKVKRPKTKKKQFDNDSNSMGQQVPPSPPDSDDMTNDQEPNQVAPPVSTISTDEQEERLPRVYQLSVEVWELIVQDLYPSQLATLAQVSRTFHDIVNYLPLWRSICAKAELGEPKKRGKCKTYFSLVLNNSERICEKCFCKCQKSGSKSALPVQLPNLDKDVNLCRDCRRAHYRVHPEPEPETDTEQDLSEEGTGRRRHSQHRTRITKGHAMSTYKLNDSDMDNIPHTATRNPYYRSAPPMRLYYRYRVIRYAREIHGGELGIEAMRTKSKQTVSTRRRNTEARIERERQEREARKTELNQRFEELKVDRTWIHWNIERYIDANVGSIENCILLASERMKKFNELAARMRAAGYEVDEQSRITVGYMSDEGGSLDKTVQRLTEEAVVKQHRELRLNEVITALSNHGLPPDRKDKSVLCRSYIASGSGELDQAMQTLVELDWFKRETFYGSTDPSRYYDPMRDWHFHRETFISRNPRSKWYALNQYLLMRLRSNNLQDVKDDNDTPARPPQSLWTRIQEMMPNVWKTVGNEHATMGFFADQENLTQALSSDPNDPSFITDDMIIKLMDEGAEAKARGNASGQEQAPEQASGSSSQQGRGRGRQNKQHQQQQLPPAPPTPPSNVSFSTAMRQAIGESEFRSYLVAARAFLVQKIKDAYILSIPQGIQTFINGCRVDPTLTRATYEERKRAFIHDEIPTISQKTNTHAAYLIMLLDHANPWSYCPSYNYARYNLQMQ